MAAVEEIPIQVPSAVATAYRNATETERLQIAARIGLMLKVATESKQDAVDRLKQTMSDISAEAEASELTPEILESILNDQ